MDVLRIASVIVYPPGSGHPSIAAGPNDVTVVSVEGDQVKTSFIVNYISGVNVIKTYLHSSDDSHFRSALRACCTLFGKSLMWQGVTDDKILQSLILEGVTNLKTVFGVGTGLMFDRVHSCEVLDQLQLGLKAYTRTEPVPIKMHLDSHAMAHLHAIKTSDPNAEGPLILTHYLPGPVANLSAVTPTDDALGHFVYTSGPPRWFTWTKQAIEASRSPNDAARILHIRLGENSVSVVVFSALFQRHAFEGTPLNKAQWHDAFNNRDLVLARDPPKLNQLFKDVQSSDPAFVLINIPWPDALTGITVVGALAAEYGTPCFIKPTGSHGEYTLC